MRINHAPPRGTGTYSIPKGEIRADRKPGTLVWQREGARIFVTCRGCDAINDITDHQIGSSYESTRMSNSCFICTNCRTHYYFGLQGWEMPDIVQCRYCYAEPDHRRFVTNKGEIRFLRKKGWVINSGDTLQSACPSCRKRQTLLRREKGT